jgi:hypothetical protein
MSYTKAISLLEKSVSRPALFSVSMGGIPNKVNDHLNFFCLSAQIPGISLYTSGAIGQENMGVGRETPHGMAFMKPLSLEIIDNSDLMTYKSIRTWIDRSGWNQNPGLSGNRNIRRNYYSNFTSIIDLVKLEWTSPGKINVVPPGSADNKMFKQSLHLKFFNAYPIKLSTIDLDASSTNTYLAFQADFTYETYIITDLNQNGFPTLPSPSQIAQQLALSALNLS